MKITLDIDEKYGDVLTFTVVGVHPNEVNVTSCAVELKEYDYVIIDENGKAKKLNGSESNGS